jgi:hypothetical protein
LETEPPIAKPKVRRSLLADVVLVLVVAGLLTAILDVADEWKAPFRAETQIDLSFWNDVGRRKAILRERMIVLPLFDRLLHVIETNPDRQISIFAFFDYLKQWCPRENLPELARTLSGGADSLDYSPTRASRWDYPSRALPSARVLTTSVIVVIR